MTAINSPFRYPGGKFYARKLILEHIIPHTYYAEPFVGGGSIFFAKDKAQTSVLSDVDDELMNCYVEIQSNVEGLISLLHGVDATKENHDYFKNIYKPTNNLERAFRWYYLNRTSYSGIMNAVNCYWGYGDKFSMRPENWPRHLRRCSAKLQGVRLECGDFARIIAEAPDGAFLFVDPPYFNADQAKFYTFGFTVDDHRRLAELLQEHGGRLCFLLTYDDSPEVRKLYRWSDKILERQWNYTINRTDDQKKKNGESQEEQPKKGKRYTGKEIFILNQKPTSAGNAAVPTQAAVPVIRKELSSADRPQVIQLAFAE